MAENLYAETHRPQFHFTPARNWMNDPNGLVFYRGEYHLFFQHNPTGINWGNMTWGHAVSPDLVHWTQLPHALEPDALGTIYSGSAVVDWQNSSSLRSGREDVLVAFFTSAGAYAPEPCPFTQSLTYSNDRGRTWTKSADNPVLGHIRNRNRDPKVFWHAPSTQWIMALYLDENDYALFASRDMKDWTRTCDLTLPGVSECPDMFELPVDGDPDNTKWVFWGASGGYLLGGFDGTRFTSEGEVRHAESGPNGYAAQTWSDIPAADGRRIQISWMARGKYPAMPFNQQMSFPVVLTLRTFEDGVHLCREPVHEIELLHGHCHEWSNHDLAPGANLVPDTESGLFDIRAVFDTGNVDAVGLIVRGHDVRYEPGASTLTCFDTVAEIAAHPDRVELRALVDRTSFELFTNAGRTSVSACFLPEAADDNLEFYAEGGTARVLSLSVTELKSAWPAPG